MKLPFTKKPVKRPVFEQPEYSENANLVGKNGYYSFEETQKNPNYQGKTGKSDGGADQARTGELLIGRKKHFWGGSHSLRNRPSATF